MRHAKNGFQYYDSDDTTADHVSVYYSPLQHPQYNIASVGGHYNYNGSSPGTLDSSPSPSARQGLVRGQPSEHTSIPLTSSSRFTPGYSGSEYYTPNDARQMSSGGYTNSNQSIPHHGFQGCLLQESKPGTEQLTRTEPSVAICSPDLPTQSRHRPVNDYVPSGENPRNSFGIRLRPVSDLPDRYRGVFKFGVFNAMQSTCFDKVLYSDENLVVSAPTGSGKTVLFELGIIRMLGQVTNNNSIKCVYVAPTKALCAEKHKEWAAKFGGLGVKSCELTGDTLGFGKGIWGEARNAQIIVTTAEKWDSLTRNWSSFPDLLVLSQIKLFLVDEVHILNESRGSTLEVVVSRMKARVPAVRFLLVSATVPNVEDIANWIGSSDGADHPATIFQVRSIDHKYALSNHGKFGEEFRPCKLSKVVYGIPKPKGQNDFVYAHTLDRRLFSLLQQHSQNKPILVFCPTRKGTVAAAKQLAMDYGAALKARKPLPWFPPTRIDLVFHDKDLASLTAMGIAVHHAGLSLDDRRAVEDLYTAKKLRVLVATSTLAVGVNLPAHMVVIKGVKLFQNGETREYSDLEILQMMGRAGRPQFDDEGIAMILCEAEVESKYRALAHGTTTIESSLHRNLVEHLNSEICLRTITDLKSARDWLRRSFLFQRIQKNPQHYDIGKEENESWQDKVDAIVMESIYSLRDSQLIMYTMEDGALCSTEYGDIMSKFYICQTTMYSILQLPGTATIRQILEMMSCSKEYMISPNHYSSKMTVPSLTTQISPKMYEKIRCHNDIRFPIRKVTGASDKVFLLVQAILAGLPLNSPEFRNTEGQPYLEAISIFRHFSRIATAIAEVAIVKRCGAQVKHALELARCLHAKAWEDHPLVLRQIEHIGEKSAKVLAEHGIGSIQKLVEIPAFRIEELLNRRPPFGSEVLAAAKEFPKYFLSVKETKTVPSDGENPVEVELTIECGLVPDSMMPRKAKVPKRAGAEMTTLLTLTSDLTFVDFRRIGRVSHAYFGSTSVSLIRRRTKALMEKKEFTLTAYLTKPSQAINIYISSEKSAGVTMTATYKPLIEHSKYPVVDTRPLTSVELDLQGLENIPDLWEMNISDDEDVHAAPAADTRSRKQETNDPGTDNAITQQAHADFYPPYKSGRIAGIAKVGKNKRPRENTSTFTPLINKSPESRVTPLFTSSPSTRNPEPSQISGSNCDRPSTPEQTIEYEEFYFDNTRFDAFPASASETTRATDDSEATPRHLTPQRGRSGSKKEKEKETNSSASIEANTVCPTREPMKSPIFEQLSVSRISGFIARTISDGVRSRDPSQEWSDNRSHQANTPVPIPSLAGVQVSPNANTNTTDDPLGEFNCWLASGAVDIVE
ncbi:hypothetical protein F5J12DRAFT_889093 [Pisolithus orientalis]|uniref:uncharacterized protein n=1 Tax=Pisolithus orientalis TaxID=936130 RepID=UPI002225AE89|nr:uncharacterized protein F5J12DRAFT_889093 [Pisolithus orientalis]KAI6028575.1 hypothetical protein F5J12DRAFT_889093 [Pisolithus orientalis]